MGYTIKGMIPVIETANDILKAAIKKESFEPTQNLRKVTHGIRMLAASYAIIFLSLRSRDLIEFII
jgi:hypothetical protein